MVDVKLSALTALAAGPAETDEIYIRDVSEAAADESKRITAVELLNPENFTELSATPAGTDEIFINDGGVGKKITVANLIAFMDAVTATLTNKTIDANGTGNAISNIDVADLANGTDGELISWDTAGAPAAVAVGTATHVLTSNGVGAAPTFQAVAGSALQSTVVAATRTAAAGAGTQSITGAGFTPTAAFVFAVEDSSPQTSSSWGMIDDADAEQLISISEVPLHDDNALLIDISDGVADQLHAVGTLTSDGIDIVWSKVGAGQDVGMAILFLR